MDFMLSRSTIVRAQWAGSAVQRAVDRFCRDLAMTLSPTDIAPVNRIMICLAPTLPAESYTMDVTEDLLTLCAADDLGAVYALLDLSREYLGIHPFWYWNDQRFEPRPFAMVPAMRTAGQTDGVALRGWDLSDAPLLSAWANETNQGWEMAFEALLRCHGNVVRTRCCAELAAAMGLRLMQDPEAPLNAPMQPVETQDPEARRALWEQAVRDQKSLPRVWTLGCGPVTRSTDPQALSEAIGQQYDAIRAAVPGAPVCLPLEGEAAALYQEGLLTLPADLVPVLTARGSDSDAGGPGPADRHGLRLSLCSRDPLTGNPLTPLPGGDQRLCRALQSAWRGGVRALWMLGVGDLRPHLQALDLAGALWRRPDTDPDARRAAYLRATFRAPDGWALTDSALSDMALCLRVWAESTVCCGDPPQPVGENYLSRCTRILACAWLCGQTDREAQAAAPVLGSWPFGEQLAEFRETCEKSLESFETLLSGCSYAGRGTTAVWGEQVLFGVRLTVYSLRGAVRFCRAYEQFCDGDYRGCFVTLGRSADDFGAAAALTQGGDGRWAGFYAGGSVGIAATARLLATLLAVPRTAGDGPDYTEWQKSVPGAGEAPLADFALYRMMIRTGQES